MLCFYGVVVLEPFELWSGILKKEIVLMKTYFSVPPQIMDSLGEGSFHYAKDFAVSESRSSNSCNGRKYLQCVLYFARTSIRL